MKRAFLIILVLTLILLSAFMQEVANAFIDGEEKFLGIIPYWDLREAIPCGVFMAGELMAAMGVCAQALLGVLRFLGAANARLDHRLNQLVLCSLWCGWTFIACCTVALGYVIPGLGTPAAYDFEVYSYFNAAGAAVVLVCYALNRRLTGRSAIVTTLLALAVGAGAGHLWHGGYVDFLLLGVFMLGAGLGVRQWVENWRADKSCLITSTAGMLLAAAYSYCLISGSGHEVDGAMCLFFLSTLILAGILSALRLAD